MFTSSVHVWKDLTTFSNYRSCKCLVIIESNNRSATFDWSTFKFPLQHPTSFDYVIRLWSNVLDNVKPSLNWRSIVQALFMHVWLSSIAVDHVWICQQHVTAFGLVKQHWPTSAILRTCSTTFLGSIDTKRWIWLCSFISCRTCAGLWFQFFALRLQSIFLLSCSQISIESYLMHMSLTYSMEK